MLKEQYPLINKTVFASVRIVRELKNVNIALSQLLAYRVGETAYMFPYKTDSYSYCSFVLINDITEETV
jgi:hypothetical protein